MSIGRKILIGLGAAVVLILGFFAYIMLTTRSHSPKALAEFSNDELKVTVDYCQPYKKGRLIFGAYEQDALQPYGEFWRVGANEATEIEINQDVLFAGQPLDKGRYVLYAVPGETTWVIGLNTDLGRWGVPEVDHDEDVMQVKVQAQKLEQSLEQLTIDINEYEVSGAMVHIKWDKVDVPISIVPR
ncbi:MAG: DUF2911 domain-containing protein [Bacteroidota bacterium]